MDDQVNKFVLQTINEDEYGAELAHLTDEINEVYLQVNHALQVADKREVNQLGDYKEKLNQIKKQL
ncbi:hypothetical protein [Aquibacillus rhizosphaerae]|uniref:Uncharacterized protein n=1 Tax=Aquibacillus rhizosphaerae TaxID=3051431 RepID=A0ABT7L4M0_9BACI|nr:hypothetical protein [Aquibacillus sp. LR5S19]MDL4839545.1 hypothetical protein [Aquibacillus sp. LR5S19]